MKEFADQAGFWKFEDDRAVLDTHAVVQNAIENMRRMEEEVTLNVVIDYLTSLGYLVVAPADESTNYEIHMDEEEL